jgi:DNA-directed RNA polymerase specialized sigma24 family protein
MTFGEYGEIYSNGGYQRTLRQLKRLGVSHNEASDLAQRAWTRGLERLSQLRTDDRLIGWVRSIAINELRTARRARPLEELSDSMFCAVGAPTLVGLEVRRAILRCCTSRQIELISLVFFDGLSCAEAAKKIGLSVGTVQQCLRRARAKMRTLLCEAIDERGNRTGRKLRS